MNASGSSICIRWACCIRRAYIENVGAHPDIPLERMTVENLRSNGREFVAEFTRIIVDEINKVGP